MPAKSRNIAFFISSNDPEAPSFKSASRHLEALASTFGLGLFTARAGRLSVQVVHAGGGEDLRASGGTALAFAAGRVREHDRFLEIAIAGDQLTVRTDYAGSVPCFLSTRAHLSLSNVLPCVVLDSGTTRADLAPANVYGFMRYMHFIWDETAYEHVTSLLPDACYVIDARTRRADWRDLATVRCSDAREGLSDAQVADELYELNQRLVLRSIRDYGQIILPLSSGYDSRMIYAAAVEDDSVRRRLRCFTYGSAGSIEVEAARRLTAMHGVPFTHVELPCRFLERRTLERIGDVFGSSLHFHGMYQLEFFDEIAKSTPIDGDCCLTSGFMTGVPAGQHNSLLGIVDANERLTSAMNRFSQSRYWPDEELARLPMFAGKEHLAAAEARFRRAFDRLDGPIHKKAVMFDVWSRQRNFISYYPRTFEWLLPTVSPHMNAEYANFFLSLSERHLRDRLAVELMFARRHPRIAAIVSNSNGVRSISSGLENAMLRVARRARKLGFGRLVPRRYRNAPFEFNLPALRHSGEAGIFPLLSRPQAAAGILGDDQVRALLGKAMGGDLASYERLITVQAIAYDAFLLDGRRD